MRLFTCSKESLQAGYASEGCAQLRDLQEFFARHTHLKVRVFFIMNTSLPKVGKISYPGKWCENRKPFY